MKILFIGNFLAAGNLTGEQPDEHHIARDLNRCANVTTMDRAEWVAHVKGYENCKYVEKQPFDIIVICKWNNYTEEAIKALKEYYKGKLVYWCWDFMWQFHKNVEYWCPDWHEVLLKHTDIYISHELGMAWKYKELGVDWRYFSWDTSDGEFDQLFKEGEKQQHEKYDVVFPGTFIDQPRSERVDILRKVKDKFDLYIFSWDFEEWRKHGFKAEPGLYGKSFAELSKKAKIILSMNSTQLRPETYGYWSNRTGKIVTTGGLPLVQYVPGMERNFSDNVNYFYGQDDIIENIKWLLDNNPQRETARVKAYDFGRARMTTQKRMKEFKILMESL